MDSVSQGLTFSDDVLSTDALSVTPTAIEWSVRIILILGFLAVLGLEAYLIWEGLSLL